MYRKRYGCPSVITVFSAPNFLATHRNMAAVLKCDVIVHTVQQFRWRPHPIRFFMDAFSWGIPFICEKGKPTRPPHAIMYVVD